MHAGPWKHLARLALAAATAALLSLGLAVAPAHAALPEPQGG